jgi:hypothetical protein
VLEGAATAVSSLGKLVYYFMSTYTGVPRKSKPTYWRVTAIFCVVTNLFPSTSFAAACCCDGFHVNWDGLYQICNSNTYT